MTDIPALHHWQPALNVEGVVMGLDDVDQAIRIILSTPKGSDPHRPEFGSDLWKYIDMPIQTATPHLVREAIEAIRDWEPRAEIVRAIPSYDAEHVTIRIQWRLADGVLQETEVRVQ